MKMNQISGLVLAVSFTFISTNAMSACDQAGDITSGSTANCWDCSANSSSHCTARFDSATGQLSISGSGRMKTYAAGSDRTLTSADWLTTAPWRQYAPNITSVDVQGINYIGHWAFIGLDKITTATIGKDVQNVGEGIFHSAYSLKNINFEEGAQIKNFSYATFANTAFETLTIPDSVESIGMDAFGGMNQLKTLIISDTTNLPQGAFKYFDKWELDPSKITIQCAGVLSTCQEKLAVQGWSSDSFAAVVQTSYERKNADGTYSHYDENGNLAYIVQYDASGLSKRYNLDGKFLGKYYADGSRVAYRIYTVDEASALVKGNKNTFSIRYR